MSPVIKYDVSDVEANEGAYLQPQPGLYNTKIVELNPRTSDGKNDIEVIVEVIEKGEYQGARLWAYINQGEASRWKMREFTDALGLPAKGGFDTTKNVGKKVRVKVTAGSWEGDYRARLQRFLKPSDSVDGADEDEGGDDYAEWSDEDLKAELEEKDITIKGRWTREKAIEALFEQDEPTEPEDEDEETETASDEYDEWSLEDLKAEADEKGILGNIPGRKTKEKLIEALRSVAGESDDSGDGEAAAEDDYDEWDVEELIDEANQRELTLPKGRKSKDKVIELLRADDNSDPFEGD